MRPRELPPHTRLYLPALVAGYRFEILAIEPAESIDLNQPDVIADEVERRTELLQHAVVVSSRVAAPRRSSSLRSCSAS